MESARPGRIRFQPPGWLNPLLDSFSDQIEPITGEARLGYEFRFADPHWELDLFLSTLQAVAGTDEGQPQHVDFRTDITRILSLFSTVYRCEWVSMTEFDGLAQDFGINQNDSFLRIEADYQGQEIWVTLKSIAPDMALSKGMRP